MRWQKGARRQKSAVTRIRTGVAAATTQSTNHYTITARHCLTTAKRASGVFVRCRERAEKHARDVKKGTDASPRHAGEQRSRQDSNLRGETPMDF